MTRRLCISALVLICLGAVVLGIRYWFNHAAKFSYSYCVEADFVSFPRMTDRSRRGSPSNRAWLRSAAVIAARNGKRLQVRLLVVQTQAGEPPLPDVDAACASWDIAGKRPFQDCPDASW
ncbi:MAG: hypothetical protein U0793_17415 [Gemmataceae bacterium]